MHLRKIMRRSRKKQYFTHQDFIENGIKKLDGGVQSSEKQLEISNALATAAVASMTQTDRKTSQSIRQIEMNKWKSDTTNSQPSLKEEKFKKIVKNAQAGQYATFGSKNEENEQ